ncbi:MAG: hypothetical protein WC753_03325 [Candidatus Gracilibacteria bacterium]
MHSSLAHNHLPNAWKLTTHAGKIRRFNFFGSLLDTLILSEVLIYQIGYVWLDVMHRKSAFFTWLREFAGTTLGGSHSLTWLGGLIAIGLLYFFVNFLIKNIFNAGLIHLIKAYIDQDEKSYKTMKAFTFGWRKSVKLAEYHSLLFWSKPVYIFYIFFWGYRFLHDNWNVIIGIAIGFMILLAVTRLLFEYARYYIIVNDSGVFEALGLSVMMTMENFGVTLRLFFSLILVYSREFVLLLAIFFLPFLMSWIIALQLGPIFLQGVFIILGLVYLLFLIIVSAMNSVIEIFVESLWFSVFRENSSSHTPVIHESHHSSHH